MHHPSATIEVNGQPVSGVFWSRLINLSVTDRAGGEADSVSIELLDGDPFLAIPEKGATIRVWLGYRETGERYMGSFVVDSVELQCAPWRMSITGKAADVREALKAQKTRHWDNKTVGEIVQAIAAEHGLQPVVSEAVAGIRYEWLGQLDESDLHLLTRLGERHGALVSYKDGRLVFAERGAGASGSGQAMTVLTVDLSEIVPGSCRVRFSDRGRHRRVTARYQDKGEQKRKEVEIEENADAGPDFALPETYANEEEATRAARAKAREQQADSDTVEFTVVGNPDLKAGTPFRLANVRPGVDGLEWTVDPAVHEYSKSGYTTRISGKRAVESGATGKKGSAGD